MAKLSAWAVTLIGVLWVLAVGGWASSLGTVTSGLMGWLIALSFLVMGVGKLMRNYGKKR